MCLDTPVPYEYSSYYWISNSGVVVSQDWVLGLNDSGDI